MPAIHWTPSCRNREQGPSPPSRAWARERVWMGSEDKYWFNLPLQLQDTEATLGFLAFSQNSSPNSWPLATATVSISLVSY